MNIFYQRIELGRFSLDNGMKIAWVFGEDSSTLALQFSLKGKRNETELNGNSAQTITRFSLNG